MRIDHERLAIGAFGAAEANDPLALIPVALDERLPVIRVVTRDRGMI